MRGHLIGLGWAAGDFCGIKGWLAQIWPSAAAVSHQKGKETACPLNIQGIINGATLAVWTNQTSPA
jgi:hypothetical protein